MSVEYPSSADSKSLRIGLLVDSLRQPAWVRTMLERIIASSHAEIVLIITNNSPPPDKAPLLSRIWRNRSNLLYSLYTKFENLFIAVEPDAFEPQTLNHGLTSVPNISVLPRQTKYSDYFSDNDLDQIRKFELDVLIRLGFRILRGDILNVAKCGIWSYHHGDNLVNCGTPPGFWEVLQHYPVTGSILQILTENLDNGTVLYRSWSATDKTWPKKNRNNYYWKSLAFIPRQLEALHRLGADRFISLANKNNKYPTVYSNKLYQTPTNAEFVRILFPHMWRYVSRRVKEMLPREQWHLRYYLGSEFPISSWKFKSITPPRDRFWADPHVVQRNGKYFIFFEEFIYAKNKGHISVMSIDQDGSWGTPSTVIERPYHLSYPHLLEWESDLYMIPESCANRTIEVYRCIHFPDRWEICHTLMEDISAVDTTLINKDGKWWLFTSIREYEGASTGEELFLFHADSPLSQQWVPHPDNPVVSDVRSARPAGGLFYHNGELYRPSQDCSKRYGYAINFNHVSVMTEDSYKEITVSCIKPNWDNKVLGVHTISSAPGITIFDAMIRNKAV